MSSMHNDESQLGADALATSGAPYVSHGSSILLVDDSVVLRDRLMEAFQERGFRVKVAADCDEAVRVFRQDPTDLAVVDLRMPGRTGLTLIPDLKAIKSDVKDCHLVWVWEHGDGDRCDSVGGDQLYSQACRCR